MTCQTCGSERLALVALPEIGPIDVQVCLACGHSWSGTEEGSPVDP